MNDKERVMSHGFANRDVKYGSLKPLIRYKSDDKSSKISDPKKEQIKEYKRRRPHGQPEIKLLFFKEYLMGVSSNYDFCSLPVDSKCITVRYEQFEGVVPHALVTHKCNAQFTDVQRLFCIIMGGVNALQTLQKEDLEEDNYGPDQVETVSKETEETDTTSHTSEEEVSERTQQCSEQSRETVTERCATGSEEIRSKGGCK